MKRPYFSRLAAYDLDEIFEYIARDKPIAASNFVERLRSECLFLASHAEIGLQRPEFGQDVRSFTVGNYVIFYRPTDDGIDVARVVHGARDLTALFRDRPL